MNDEQEQLKQDAYKPEVLVVGASVRVKCLYSQTNWGPRTQLVVGMVGEIVETKAISDRVSEATVMFKEMRSTFPHGVPLPASELKGGRYFEIDSQTL